MRTPEEKRKHARVAVLLKYSLEIDRVRYTGFTGNISMGGVYLQDVTPPLPRDKLTRAGIITLELDPQTVAMDCQIVFIGGRDIPKLGGVGVAFLGPNRAAMETLQQFLLGKL